MQLFFDFDDTNKLSKTIDTILNRNMNKDVIFLCIGTQKVIGDSFGPILGNMLNSLYDNVYGNLTNTINATNIDIAIKDIFDKYDNPYIIVFDSALGNENLINKIVIGKGGIKPGSALDKNIDEIGDMYINAIVEKCGKSNFEQLKKVKLDNILKMSMNTFIAINNCVCLKNKRMVNNHIN